MKIALYNLTTTTAYGGVESFVWDLANHLAARQHDVHVWGGHGQRREGSAAVHVRTFPFIDRNAFRWIPGFDRAYAERKLLERLSMAVTAVPALIAGRYDIIHIQKPYDLLPALIAGRLSGAKVILGCHGEDFYRGDRWLAKQVDGAVSCSRFNAETVMRRYPIDIEVVYNGIDTQLFCPAQSIPPAPKHLRVLFVGRLQPWKGVDTALHAIAQCPDMTLTVAGDGGHRGELEHLAATLGIMERVRFLGSVERSHIPALMHQHDVLVATSHASETFGIGLVEAQACGLPVVASRFGGFVEVVAEERTGLFFAPRDANALAVQLQRLQQDRALLQTMAAAAPTWAAQFAWPRITNHVERYYQHCLCLTK